MRDADLFTPRPTLTNTSLIERAVQAIGQGAGSKAEVWQRLTDSFAVDLDAVAALMPRAEPEPLWLAARD